MIKPFGKNILFKPQVKDKVIGDTSNYLLYGEVLAVGDKVENIKVGDTIGYNQWGINKVEQGEETHFFILERDDFILAVL